MVTPGGTHRSTYPRASLRGTWRFPSCVHEGKKTSETRGVSFHLSRVSVRGLDALPRVREGSRNVIKGHPRKSFSKRSGKRSCVDPGPRVADRIELAHTALKTRLQFDVLTQCDLVPFRSVTNVKPEPLEVNPNPMGIWTWPWRIASQLPGASNEKPPGAGTRIRMRGLSSLRHRPFQDSASRERRSRRWCKDDEIEPSRTPQE
jgi:hypothetical protein